MPRLTVLENSLEFSGVFARPLFGLWGQGGVIVGSLYTALAKYHRGLSSFSSPGDSASPSSQAVIVSLGPRSDFRFKFDRIEANLQQFTPADLDGFADVLIAGTGWLAQYQPDSAFSAQIFTYRCHASIDGSDSTTFLGSLGTPRLDALGKDEGTGTIFHGVSESGSVRLQLMLDHSLRLTGGLFVEFQGFITTNDLPYGLLVQDMQSRLNAALAEIGLILQAQ